MTASWRGFTGCPACGAQVSTEQPIDAWIRNHPELRSDEDGINITDGDKWVHRYAVRQGGSRDRTVQYLMSIEIKTFAADMGSSQRDTLHMANQLLRTTPWKEQRDRGRLQSGHAQNVRVLHSVMNGRKVQVLCYGVHKLRLSGATPDDSEWITWDFEPVTAEQLVKLFRFELHPDSLRIMEHRHHKYTPPVPEMLPGIGG